MSVTARKYVRRDTGEVLWEADVNVALPNVASRPIRSRKRRFRTKAAAMAWGSALERQLVQHGHPQRKEVPTLDQILPEYLTHSAKIGGRRGRAGAGWLRHQQASYRNWIAPRLGLRKVDEIGARDLDRIAADMADAGREARTVRNVLQTLRGILGLARRYGHVRDLPDFPAIHLRRPRRTIHSFEDSQRLLDLAREAVDPSSFLVVALGCHAGLRAGEMLGLQWGDVDLHRGCLHVRRTITADGRTKPPKTEAGERTVPLTPTLLAAFRQHGARLPWLFWGEDGGQATHKWLKVRVAPLLRAAGLPASDPLHALRRTFCTQCRLRAIPEVQVKRWMGHTGSQDVTDVHYTGEFPMDSQRAWIGRLEASPVAGEGSGVASQWRAGEAADGSDGFPRGRVERATGFEALNDRHRNLKTARDLRS